MNDEWIIESTQFLYLCIAQLSHPYPASCKDQGNQYKKYIFEFAETDDSFVRRLHLFFS